jgi:hypothetical protein
MPAWLLQGTFQMSPDAGSFTASANAVALAENGDVFVTGSFQSTISSFSGSPDGGSSGGGPVLSYVDMTGTRDAYLAAFAGNGALRWAKTLGGPGVQEGYDVAVDPKSGDVVITGKLEGNANFGPGENLTSAGMGDIFVARYDKERNPRWAKNFGDSNDQYGVKVAFDPSGQDVILAAFGSGQFDFGDGNMLGDASASCQLFLVKLNANGVRDASGYALQRTCGGPPIYDLRQNGMGIAVDPIGGDIFVTGIKDDTSTDFFGNPDARTGMFVAAFDSKLAWRWGNVFVASPADASTPYRQWGNAVTVAPCGDVYVTGAFEGSLQMGTQVLVDPESPDDGGTEHAYMFVARLGNDGTPISVRSFGDSGEQEGASISVDARSNVLVTGWITSDANSTSKGIDFGDGFYGPRTPPLGMYYPDAFVLRLSADLKTTRFAQRFGDSSKQEALGSATDPAGNIVVVGRNEGMFKYLGMPLDANANANLFVLKAGP